MFSSFSIATMIYYLNNTDKWDLWGHNLGFVVLIAGMIYTVYMTIREVIKRDEPQIVAASDGLNVNEITLGKNFMLDNYFKYLFSFSTAVILFYVIHVLRNNFKIYEEPISDWYYITDVYTNLILPLFIILEVFITTRYRHHHPVADLIVLFTICLLHCVYKILIIGIYYDTSKIVFPTIADYIMIYIFALNGYIFYDYLLYAKQNPIASDYNIYSA